MSLYAIFSGKSRNKPMPVFGSLHFTNYLICTTSDLEKANNIFNEESKLHFKWVQMVCLFSNKVLSSCISYNISKPIIFNDANYN